MRYQCLIFDHDDTVVNSTATIHWPCFVDYLALRRPGMDCSLEKYFIKNFSPGFIEMCREDYGLSDEDLTEETLFWQNYVRSHIPAAYPGIREIMARQKAEGGLVCVVSHSFDFNIRRDYEANGLPTPDAVFGWEQPLERRKPHPWPLQEILRKTGLSPSDLLMVDDLKPGFDMANAAGVDFAAALWAHDIPEIRTHMHHCCPVAFEDPTDLESWLFD